VASSTVVQGGDGHRNDRAEAGQTITPRDEFTARPGQKPPIPLLPTAALAIGMTPAISPSDMHLLEDGLSRRLPVPSLVTMGVAAVRSMSDRVSAKGAIGKDLTSVVLSPFRSPTLETGQAELHLGQYHPASAVTHVVPGVDEVIALNPAVHFALRDISLEPLEKDDETLFVGKVPRNQRCPCGSGLKYKHCHGGPRSVGGPG
jgi:hypothetical protein